MSSIDPIELWLIFGWILTLLNTIMIFIVIHEVSEIKTISAHLDILDYRSKLLKERIWDLERSVFKGE